AGMTGTRSMTRLNWNGIGGSHLSLREWSSCASKSGEGLRLIIRAKTLHPDFAGRCFASPGAIRPLPGGETGTEHVDPPAFKKMNMVQSTAASPSPSNDIIARFRKIVGVKYALTEAADIAPYTTEERDLFHGHSPLVLRPGSTAEVSAICKLSNEQKIALVPQ